MPYLLVGVSCTSALNIAHTQNIHTQNIHTEHTHSHPSHIHTQNTHTEHTHREYTQPVHSHTNEQSYAPAQMVSSLSLTPAAMLLYSREEWKKDMFKGL